MTSVKIFWIISLILIHQTFLANAYCTKSLVPALYVFGDSSVDAGNNNNLNTPAKANTFPHGIDFNNCSTGRFSNGKTFADIIAIRLGLPMPPPYLGVSETERYQIATGINYASASSGILNSTGDGEYLSLDKQIEYFTSTVENDLPRILPNKIKLRHYLSKSIYLLSIGANDYTLGYLRNVMGTNNVNPEEYANFLLKQFTSHIKKIYDLGARKFVIVSVGPVGCIPGLIIRTLHSQYCNEDINQKIKPYSDKLHGTLQELQTQLPSSKFITMDTYNLYKVIRNSPEKFGITNVFDSCIGQGEKICENRKLYYFYDPAHTTEAVNEIYAKECFSGNQTCFPFNIKQLIHSH
ncbi:GDSL esterase/lipase At1g71691-like [Abrus precatorius]|uniref:GDSL esterase/lipase At1g71691-like n=1 Tax=Abrus precatorius TaxID=3816 RepID=A0A8B8KKM0_ABRPR|nr:GDSL esterase/lipase At1g71691-like [Abrus precatorius]